MRRMYSNKELTEIIKQVIEEQGLGGGALDVVVLEDSQAEFENIKFPFNVILMGEENPILLGTVTYGGQTLVDPVSTESYDVTINTNTYDPETKEVRVSGMVSLQV